MREKNRPSANALGGSSLLAIFAVLCMLVLAMLSLRTVQTQQRLSETAANATSAYYRADLQAQAIFARLRQGEMPEGVEAAEGIFRFSCPISETQTLMAELKQTDDSWQILRWQAIALSPEEAQFLPVWDGEVPE